MLVSLASHRGGFACGIASAIERIASRERATLFFDWVACSIKSINEVLIENKALVFEDDRRRSTNTHCILYFKGFHKLCTVHDFTFDNFSDPATRHGVVEKYTRRKERFLQTLQNENQILFFRYVDNDNDLQSDELLRFDDFINNLRHGRLYKIIIITNDPGVKLPPRPEFVLKYCNHHFEPIQYDLITDMYENIMKEVIRKELEEKKNFVI
jgi:hypothetical protein